MNISAWSIRNPAPAILLFVLLCLFGALGFRSLGIQQFPDIEFPAIIVSVSLDGASPAQMESEVARKIEDQIAGLPGIKHIRSTLSEGSASIIAEFSVDKDPEEALSDTRDAVERVRSELPADLLDPIVSKVTTSASPIISFAAESSSLDEADLSWLIDDALSRHLLSVPGVAKVSRIGGVSREILILLDPDRARELSVSPREVSSQIRLSLRDSSGDIAEISAILRRSIQEHASHAGIEILEAKIIHLAYAPEIAHAMLRRQQAEAVVSARQKIVEGAVKMTDHAIRDLEELGVVSMDQDTRSALAVNLMTVLVGDSEASPVIPLSAPAATGRKSHGKTE